MDVIQAKVGYQVVKMLEKRTEAVKAVLDVEIEWLYWSLYFCG